MSLNIAHQRLLNQHLACPSFETPKEAVTWFGAVQAQDYPAALWGIGQRMKSATEATVAQAMADGAIIRTHTMRGTWHFIAPEDLRWFLALTGKRQAAKYAHYFRQLGLDDDALNRGKEALIRALEGGKSLTRKELDVALDAAGLSVPNLGSTFVLMHGESEGIIASGARRSKQFTYRLVDEFVPPTPALERDEALAKMVARYFTSHGPATLKDFVWWTGLTVADAKVGLALAQSQLEQEMIEGNLYWFSPAQSEAGIPSPSVHLLPAFDEYTVAYKDRSALQHPLHMEKTRDPFVNLGPVIVVEGRVVGTWRRTLGKGSVAVSLNPFGTLTEAENEALMAEVQRYGDFLGLPVTLT